MPLSCLLSIPNDGSSFKLKVSITCSLSVYRPCSVNFTIPLSVHLCCSRECLSAASFLPKHLPCPYLSTISSIKGKRWKLFAAFLPEEKDFLPIDPTLPIHPSPSRFFRFPPPVSHLVPSNFNGSPIFAAFNQRTRNSESGKG